jgi:hypothetical protein
VVGLPNLQEEDPAALGSICGRLLIFPPEVWLFCCILGFISKFPIRSSDVSFLVPSALLTPERVLTKGTLDIRNLVPSALLSPEMGAHKKDSWHP